MRWFTVTYRQSGGAAGGDGFFFCDGKGTNEMAQLFMRQKFKSLTI